MSIGSNIRKIREMKGFSQEYIAKKIGISPQAYSKLEREKTRMDAIRLESIAQYLEVGTEDIILFDEGKIFKNTLTEGVQKSQFLAKDISHGYDTDQKIVVDLHDAIKQLREANQDLKKTNEMLWQYLQTKSS